jgi:hypothetical protein
MISTNQIHHNLNKINPTAKMVYYGFNKQPTNEQPLTTTKNIMTNPNKPKTKRFGYNPSSNTIKMARRLNNYYGFEKIKGIDNIVDVNIGTNPTEAGIMASGVLTTKKNILVNQYEKSLMNTEKQIQKEQIDKDIEQQKEETIKEDVLLSYITR